MIRKAFFLYLVVCVYVKKMVCEKTNFVFPEYPYKETNKNVSMYSIITETNLSSKIIWIIMLINYFNEYGILNWI